MDSKNTGIDLNTLQKMMKEVRENQNFLDSVSPNQFKSKLSLIKHIEDLQVINEESDIVIFGGWYGSILIPAFQYVKRITLIDNDPKVISIAKYRIFDDYQNVDFISSDVFSHHRFKRIKDSNLIINTSCEHMPSMSELSALYKSNAYFAFQSNNMFDIPTHVNCVSSIDEFYSQLPRNATVITEDEIEDNRGIRFTIIGKFDEGLE